MSSRSTIRQLDIEAKNLRKRAIDRAQAEKDPTLLSENRFVNAFLDPRSPWDKEYLQKEAALKKEYADAMAKKAAEPHPALKHAHAILQRRGIAIPPVPPRPVETPQVEEVDEFVLPDNDNQALHTVHTPAQLRRIAVAHVHRDYIEPARQHLDAINSQRTNQ